MDARVKAIKDRYQVSEGFARLVDEMYSRHCPGLGDGTTMLTGNEAINHAIIEIATELVMGALLPHEIDGQAHKEEDG